mgnify:CR=1 FL=1
MRDVFKSPEAPDYLVPDFANEVIANPDNEDADWTSPNEPATWPGTTFVNPRPEIGMDSKMSSVTARLDYDLSDRLTFVSLTNYADLERDDVSDRGGVKYEIAVDREVGSIESFSQEFRLTGSSSDGKTNFIGGVYYSRDKLDDRGGAVFVSIARKALILFRQIYERLVQPIILLRRVFLKCNLRT